MQVTAVNVSLRTTRAGLFIFLILSLSSFSSSASSQQLLLHERFGSAITLPIAQHKIQAWLANTPKQQRLGLMNIRSLPKDSGLLFVYPKQKRHCMWMKNTLINLSVAFADAEGFVVNIEQMHAQLEATNDRQYRIYCSSRPAIYALEMPYGWFQSHAVTVGDQLDLTQIDRSDRSH